MPYYVVGDYYGRGDYYRGDGIFGTIGKAISGIARVGVGAIVGGLTKGPAGVIPGAVGAGVKVAMDETKKAVLMADVAGAPTAAMDLARQKMLHSQAVMRATMNREAILAARGAGVPMLNAMGVPMLGPGELMLMGRRRRRMNVTNVRALRRGIRRIAGFAKIARRVLVLSKRVKKPKRK